MNEEKLKLLRDTALRTLRILRMIETGHRSTTAISTKVGATPQLVAYYMKQLEIK